MGFSELGNSWKQLPAASENKADESSDSEPKSCGPENQTMCRGRLKSQSLVMILGTNNTAHITFTYSLLIHCSYTNIVLGSSFR